MLGMAHWPQHRISGSCDIDGVFAISQLVVEAYARASVQPQLGWLQPLSAIKQRGRPLEDHET